MRKPNGFVIYRGPSMLDGAPIVAIAITGGSTNRKTGDMVQTYILRDDVQPTDAIRTGADASICGACPHRGDGTGKGRTCYVNVGQGPLGVWRAYKRGRYPNAGGHMPSPYTDLPTLGVQRVVRLGTYGDPAAVPVYIWEALTAYATAHTGYTHQWRTFPALRELCMASVDNESEASEARAAGWRTFRVAFPTHTARLQGEARCPASAEAGKLLQCHECRACGGTKSGRRGSIVIQAHGGFAVMANVRRAVA